jgi:hypothetical protein
VFVEPPAKVVMRKITTLIPRIARVATGKYRRATDIKGGLLPGMVIGVSDIRKQ